MPEYPEMPVSKSEYKRAARHLNAAIAHLVAHYAGKDQQVHDELIEPNGMASLERHLLKQSE